VKNLFLVLIVILSTSFSGKSQTDSLEIRLAGIINATDTMEQTPFVHIINMRTGRGVISDSLGIFKTKLIKTDTLLFRCLGFEDSFIQLPDSIKSTICFLEVVLSPTSYNLGVVDIIALSRESQFRYDFLNMPPDKNAWERQIIIPGVTRSEYQWIRKEEKFKPKKTFDGPISALYFKFSDEGKSLMKLAELLEEDEKQEIIDEKFNKELLAGFTGYSGGKLDRFYQSLNFSSQYLFETPAYDIFLRVKQKMEDFEITYTGAE